MAEEKGIFTTAVEDAMVGVNKKKNGDEAQKAVLAHLMHSRQKFKD